MLEELPEAGSTIRVGQLITFAYQMTQATYSTNLVLKHFVIIYMGLSMRPVVDHCQHFTTTMYHVQCAMFPPGEQCWWYLQRPSALPPGPVSTTATWWLNAIITIIVCLNVLIKTRRQCLHGGAGNQEGVLFMWKQPALGLHALHIHSWERTSLCSVYQMNLQLNNGINNAWTFVAS